MSWSGELTLGQSDWLTAYDYVLSFHLSVVAVLFYKNTYFVWEGGSGRLCDANGPDDGTVLAHRPVHC